MTKEILVIDDNSDIRQLISGILRDQGMKVREAANYDQASFEIDKQLPDIAVIDVKLDKGDKDGIDLLKKIKSINDLVPVIVISGHRASDLGASMPCTSAGMVLEPVLKP